MTFLIPLAAAVFLWQDIEPGRTQLSKDGKPVLVYNSGMQLANGAPPDKRRCCYVHPLYAPNGAMVTDDFPADHWHHRGIFWSWPVVRFEGQTYDMWMKLAGIERRTTGVTHKDAELTAENGWFLGDRKILEERVRIRPAKKDDGIEFELEFEALKAPVELAGAPEEDKGYGGFSVRFAPRQNTVIRTDKGIEPKDTNNEPHKWAELSADYSGGPATLRIEDDQANGWCIRNYGFLGVNFPGLKPFTLMPGKPLKLRYTVSVR